MYEQLLAYDQLLKLSQLKELETIQVNNDESTYVRKKVTVEAEAKIPIIFNFDGFTKNDYIRYMRKSNMSWITGLSGVYTFNLDSTKRRNLIDETDAERNEFEKIQKYFNECPSGTDRIVFEDLCFTESTGVDPTPSLMIARMESNSMGKLLLNLLSGEMLIYILLRGVSPWKFSMGPPKWSKSTFLLPWCILTYFGSIPTEKIKSRADLTT